MPSNKTDILAVLIVLSALILGVTSVWNDAPIVDEIPHIGAGYSYVAKLDHRLNPEHPPLAKDLAGLSLKLYGIQDEQAFQSRFWQDDLNGQWEFGRKLIFNSGNDANRVSHFAKLPLLIFFVISAIIIFIWTRELAGNNAALIALFLFSFSPTIIAHSRFVTTDVPALFGVLLSSHFFLHYLKKPNRLTFLVAGLTFGVAQLTKFSLFLLIPYFLLMAAVYGFMVYSGTSRIKSSLKSFATTVFIIAFGYIFIVWPVYILHTWNYPPDLQQSQTEELLQTYGRRWMADTVTYMADKPLLRGLSEYGLGFLMVTQRSVGGNTTYFMGEVRNWAWPQYFPIVYFIKEPLAFWGLLITVILFLTAKLKLRPFTGFVKSALNWAKNNFDKFFMFGWLALYWIVSIRANLNIGVRHLMPVYGFTLILLACGLVYVARNISSKKLLTSYYVLVSALFGWYLYENLNVYPYYLTYFNQTAGGPAGGHNYVVDSNLDWGQDLKRLADWVEENNIQKINFDYFGWSDPSYYLGYRWDALWAGRYKNAREYLAENPNGGYLAVSASFYMGSFENPETSYAWLENYEPVAIIGNSIFVWHITP